MGNHWHINHTESPEWYWVKSQVNVYIWRRKDQALREKKKKKRNKHLEGVINEVGSIPSNTVSRKPNEESCQYNPGRKDSQLFPMWLKKDKELIFVFNHVRLNVKAKDSMLTLRRAVLMEW